MVQGQGKFVRIQGFAFLLCLVFMPKALWAYDFIQVSGEGEVKAKPDFVWVSASVFSRAMAAQTAQKMNAKEMARVEKVLKQDFKIDPKDIQTSSFQVQPQYDYGKDKPTYKGMLVTHYLKIKFRRVDELGQLLDKLAENSNQESLGVRIDDTTFGTDQAKVYQIQALENAMAEAKARAQALAKASGKTIVAVRKISEPETAQSTLNPIRSFGKMAASMDTEASTTHVSPGEISVHADVQVEFEVK